MAEYETYEDKAGEWRWKLVEANGKIVAESGEGYGDRSGVERAIENVKSEASEANVEQD